jgi:hypothetical protein
MRMREKGKAEDLNRVREENDQLRAVRCSPLVRNCLLFKPRSLAGELRQQSRKPSATARQTGVLQALLCRA